MKQLTLLFVLTLSTFALAGKPTKLTFSAGDRVPITLLASGDLFETETDTPVYVTVKKTFHLKLTSQGPLISFDDVAYFPYRDVLDSQARVEATGNHPVAIAVSIDAKLK